MSTGDPQNVSESAPALLRSSAIVGSMTMLSRVLGLVRDIVIAGFVGASANADAPMRFLLPSRSPISCAACSLRVRLRRRLCRCWPITRRRAALLR
jgi:hypothetical protein